ncbi:MAG: hypothetical protein J6J62_09830 [Oscillospiraceae bacterium]|nr:hypothetical protein [Oscillospiraceae bacterium]
MKKKMCCEAMEYHSRLHCEEHSSVFDCPDCLVFYDKSRDDYGLIIHDGGQSFIKISYCPWCGKKLEK